MIEKILIDLFLVDDNMSAHFDDMVQCFYTQTWSTEKVMIDLFRVDEKHKSSAGFHNKKTGVF